MKRYRSEQESSFKFLHISLKNTLSLFIAAHCILWCHPQQRADWCETRLPQSEQLANMMCQVTLAAALKLTLWNTHTPVYSAYILSHTYRCDSYELSETQIRTACTKRERERESASATDKSVSIAHCYICSFCFHSLVFHRHGLHWLHVQRLFFLLNGVDFLRRAQVTHPVCGCHPSQVRVKSEEADPHGWSPLLHSAQVAHQTRSQRLLRQGLVCGQGPL